MKRKINVRLILIAVIVAIASTVCATIAYYNIFQKQVKDELKVNAQVLKDTHYFESAEIDPDSIDLSTNNRELRVTWVDQDGTVLYDNDTDAATLENHKNRPEIKEAFETGSGESVRKSDTLNMSTFYYAVLLDNGTVLRVATEARNIQSVFAAALPVLAVIILMIIVICILLSHMLTRQLIRPIEEMGAHMDTGMEPPYKELEPFADTIRRQHEDILAAAKMRQDFTANVSHELKTPLTAISGYAELIENGMADQEGEAHFLREIRRNSERLLTLINDIIGLSELDHMEKGTEFEETDLYDIVSEQMDAFTVAADQRDITVTLKGGSCPVRGNRELLSELIENLVHNAIRYNNNGGKVEITTAVENGSRVLSVKDNGIGIPRDEQNRIFERFYRVDKSRSKETGGTGLGLAIVKHIADIHDAEISVKSELGSGTEITVRF